MTKQAFVNELAELMEIEPSDLVDSYPLDENSNWDSLTRVSAIAMIDEHFQLTLDYRDLRDCHSLGHLMKLIEHKKTSHSWSM